MLDFFFLTESLAGMLLILDFVGFHFFFQVVAEAKLAELFACQPQLLFTLIAREMKACCPHNMLSSIHTWLDLCLVSCLLESSSA
jgi:hypothetical protein